MILSLYSTPQGLNVELRGSCVIRREVLVPALMRHGSHSTPIFCTYVEFLVKCVYLSFSQATKLFDDA